MAGPTTPLPDGDALGHAAERPLLDLCQAVPSYPPAEDLREHLAGRVRLFETAQYTAITGIAPLRVALP